MTEDEIEKQLQFKFFPIKLKKTLISALFEKNRTDKKFPGCYAFKLCTEYGFPVELVQEMCRPIRQFKNGIDMAEFNRLMQIHRYFSGKSRKRLFGH